MTPGVYITVDVECSMGGAWRNPSLHPVPPSRAMMGEYGNQQLGLPLIADILCGNGVAGTFFVEAFTEEQGFQGQTEGICQYLLDRGQDVQLHIHPNHKHFALHQKGLPYPFTDDMADLSAEQQTALLAEGCQRLARWTGVAPVAFRAGNMAASEAVLPQVSAAGLRIDSSYCFPFAGGQCRFRPEEPYNGTKWYGDVLELALSGFYQPPWPGLKPARPLDVVGTSFEECRDGITRICQAGAEAVVILHSFSLFKVRSVQYDGGRLNRIVARRFRRLCEWLAEHKDEFPARTCRQLAEAIGRGQYTAKAVTPPRLSGPRALVRSAVQAVNRYYWA